MCWISVVNGLTDQNDETNSAIERSEIDEREREQRRREQQQPLRPAVRPEETGEPQPGRP